MGAPKGNEIGPKHASSGQPRGSEVRDHEQQGTFSVSTATGRSEARLSLC